MDDLAAIASETEADTRAERIDPALAAQGWGTLDGTRVRREVIAPGRILEGGRRATPMTSDYVLIYRGQKLAAMEAKRAGIAAAEGVAQAKEYARRLRARFAYATNGRTWYEIDMVTGVERDVDGPPTPIELWNRTFGKENEWRNRFGAIPFETGGGKWEPRYYQHNAINAALEAIAKGEDRILLTLATGTGKTGIAVQLCWKLFQSKWSLNREPTRRPRILFLADRNILADQAFNSFGMFEDGVCKRIDPNVIRKSGIPKNASIFFTIFQTFTTGENGDETYRQYDTDFFDLIIVDECHRGGANSESSWRDILNHFEPAVQIGLTATPKRTDNADTYEYFGAPVYEYSLREGINDGYLTPFRVRQYVSTIDTYTFEGEDKVVKGEVADGTQFAEKDFNRIIKMRKRELHRVRTFLSEIDTKQKTLVFCATQAHAALIRDLINQEVRHENPDYCVRVTANDGKEGDRQLERFQLNSKTIPTILTTSQKLSTGVDAKNVRNIVLMRPVNSMIEFKQIIGRGTRTIAGKDYFTIYDFVKAHLNFEDPSWDGEPVEVITNPRPKTKGDDDETEEGEISSGGQAPFGDPDPRDPKPEMIEIELGDGQIVNMSATTFWGPDGKPISAQDFIKRMFGELPELFKDEEELTQLWSNPDTRTALLEGLADRGYDALVLSQIQDCIQAENSDLYDVLAYIAYATIPKTREVRADIGRAVVNSNYDEKLAEFLNYVLGQYVETGVEDLGRDKLSDYLTIKFGSPVEGAKALGGIEKAIESYIGFQAHLY
jgi:type I restriction enzyme R subunit